MNRTLFISFTRLIYALRRGETTTKELNNGLFFFGCVREHVMSALPPESEYNKAKECWNYAYSKDFAMREWFVWDKKVPYKETFQYAKALQIALEKAEREGRIVWRTKDERADNWQKLFDLLKKFGINAGLDEMIGDNYCYPKVVELVSPHMKVIG